MSFSNNIDQGAVFIATKIIQIERKKGQSPSWWGVMTSALAYHTSTRIRTRKRIGPFSSGHGFKKRQFSASEAGFVWAVGPKAQDGCVFAKKSFLVEGAQE